MNFIPQQLTPEQQLEVLFQQKQQKEYLRLYNYLVNKCFDDCINSFTTKALSDREINCTRRCAKKYMKLNDFASIRFSEENQNLINEQNQH
ncbi:hypothetical protein BB559_002497 [Furculomyces boomerangus]|uniref:Mitochondrial import inner membrane translocase subunit n=2 Tax=Harpellales TaxID=61421 RepID=A0A2T9YUY5_9FUNG|nr:hypothetical protein BB559_002497 [Furculomyces boomerangus]PWA02370.1 hypothetical protein BB558_001479 [Smittium angustum]